MQITNTAQSLLQKKYQDRMESCLHLLLEASQWYHCALLHFGHMLKIICQALSSKKRKYPAQKCVIAMLYT